MHIHCKWQSNQTKLIKPHSQAKLQTVFHQRSSDPERGVPHPAINTDGPWPLKAYGTRHTHHVTSRGSLSLMSSVYEEEMVTACEGHTNVWEITLPKFQCFEVLAMLKHAGITATFTSKPLESISGI